MYCWRAFESVWSELLKKDQSGHPNLWKATNYDEHQIWPSWNTGHKLHTKKQWLRLSLRTIQYGTNTHKRYFYTFRINQITFTYGERKKERPNFYGMFRQSLLNSAAFTAILKMKLPQCNAIGVRTHRLEDNIFQIDRSLVLMRACFLLSSFWWKMSKIHFIKRTNLIAARIYSQATQAHWKKTDGFYSPWAKCCMRNEKRCVTCASKQLHNI